MRSSTFIGDKELPGVLKKYNGAKDEKEFLRKASELQSKLSKTSIQLTSFHALLEE